MSDRLPANWDRMSLPALWNALNDPRRFSTPDSTVEAIVYSVQQRGLAALDEPANIERLSRCDAAARAEVNRRIEKLSKKGAAA